MGGQLLTILLHFLRVSASPRAKLRDARIFKHGGPSAHPGADGGRHADTEQDPGSERAHPNSADKGSTQ
eukprot:scaffold16061_cov116-Isochrysis_galbana.AAC.7